MGPMVAVFSCTLSFGSPHSGSPKSAETKEVTDEGRPGLGRACKGDSRQEQFGGAPSVYREITNKGSEKKINSAALWEWGTTDLSLADFALWRTAIPQPPF